MGTEKTTPVEVGSNLGLGPLPKPHMRESHATAQNTRSVRQGYEQGGYVRWPDMYTADQMRDYAAQQVAALRAAGLGVVEHMEGRLPVRGWLRDNDKSRDALAELVRVLGA